MHPALPSVQRLADRVGMDLQPERRFGGAARDYDPLGRECGAEILHDEFCAETDAFNDRSINVRRRVLERQAYMACGCP